MKQPADFFVEINRDGFLSFSYRNKIYSSDWPNFSKINTRSTRKTHNRQNRIFFQTFWANDLICVDSFIVNYHFIFVGWVSWEKTVDNLSCQHKSCHNFSIVCQWHFSVCLDDNWVENNQIKSKCSRQQDARDKPIFRLPSFVSLSPECVIEYHGMWANERQLKWVRQWSNATCFIRYLQPHKLYIDFHFEPYRQCTFPRQFVAASTLRRYWYSRHAETL